MKEKREDKILRELFRQKLENAEIIPSQSVSTDLMHRLGRREFLHFNPVRFNIWYAGAILMVGAALAIILTSGNDHNDKMIPDSIETDNNIITGDQGATIIPNENQKPAGDLRKNTNPKTDRLKPLPGTEDVNKTDYDFSDRKHVVPSRSDITGTLPENGIFHEAADEKSKLRSVKQTSGLIKASVTQGCCPLKIVFKNGALSYSSCKWTFGDGGYSEEKDPEWIFDVEGEYKVTLKIFDSEGLQSVSSSAIVVYPKPVARFEIIAGNDIMPDDQLDFVNYSLDAVKFRWNFGDGDNSELFEPVHTYNKSGKYDISLVVISEYGCSDTLTVSNAFTGSANFIKFPNAFMPNPNGPSSGYYSTSSDEEGHVFHPFFSGVSEYQLRIFSRPGVLIFESNDINIGWDGYYKGQLCQSGVYIWKVRGNYINGEPFTKMGDLTLLKN